MCVSLHKAYSMVQGWCVSVCIKHTLGYKDGVSVSIQYAQGGTRVVCQSAYSMHRGGKGSVCHSV